MHDVVTDVAVEVGHGEVSAVLGDAGRLEASVPVPGAQPPVVDARDVVLHVDEAVRGRRAVRLRGFRRARLGKQDGRNENLSQRRHGGLVSRTLRLDPR